MSRSELESLKNRLIGLPDREMHLCVGFFLAWFAAAELRLSLLLAYVTNARDLDMFDLLTRGMDARVKVERLRSACRTRCKIDPKTFGVRLDWFEGKIIPLRNKIAHGFMWRDEDVDGVYHLVFLTRIPWAKVGRPDIKGRQQPEIVKAETLMLHGDWLRRFNEDLTQPLRCARQKQTLRIERPQSHLPMESP